MNHGFSHPPPGVVGVVAAGGVDAGRAASMALMPFDADAAMLLLDGPLAVAFEPSADRASTVSESTLCVLEGALYSRGGGSQGGRAPAVVDAVAAAYARRGADALTDFRGDYWVLLWDRVARRGIVACDQLGGRAPYWAASGAAVVFASEIRELLAALPRQPGADAVAMAHWLSLSVPPAGRTLHEGIRRLEAGNLLQVGDGPGRQSRYWTPRFRPVRQESRAGLVGRVREALEVSVRRRTAGEPALGLLLSGGLDSSAVAAVATRVADQPPSAYSATFPTLPTVDETDLIDTTTAHLGLHSTRLAVQGGSVIYGALSYLAAWEAPPTSPNLFFWAPLLARAGTDGIKVMLDGEGGDEVFGLSPYLIADELRRGRPGRAIGLTQRLPGAPAHLEWKRTGRLLRRWGIKGALPGGAHVTARRLRGQEHYGPAWLLPHAARTWIETEASYAWKWLPGPRWWAYLVDTITRGHGPALVYEQSRRRTAMAGIDARHPLVDVDLVELILQIPPELAFDPAVSRPLLREAVSGLLPDRVRMRPAKSSFDALFHQALAGAELNVVRRLLRGSDVRVGAYADLRWVLDELVEPGAPADRRARQEWAIILWRIVTAECWLRSREDADFLASLADREGLTPIAASLATVDPRAPANEADAPEVPG